MYFERITFNTLAHQVKLWDNLFYICVYYFFIILITSVILTVDKILDWYKVWQLK